MLPRERYSSCFAPPSSEARPAAARHDASARCLFACWRVCRRPARVRSARSAQRQRAARYGGDADDDIFSSAHARRLARRLHAGFENARGAGREVSAATTVRPHRTVIAVMRWKKCRPDAPGTA